MEVLPNGARVEEGWRDRGGGRGAGWAWVGVKERSCFVPNLKLWGLGGCDWDQGVLGRVPAQACFIHRRWM